MYKELVERLRKCFDKGVYLPSDILQAADAIETTGKLEHENLMLRIELDRLRRERDQAVEELHRNTDAVPVVRCKDCKWFTMDNTGGTYCNHLTCGLFNGYEPDAFCSYGERKEN